MELEIFLIALIARNFLRLYIHCFCFIENYSNEYFTLAIEYGKIYTYDIHWNAWL